MEWERERRYYILLEESHIIRGKQREWFLQHSLLQSPWALRACFNRCTAAAAFFIARPRIALIADRQQSRDCMTQANCRIELGTNWTPLKANWDTS